MASGGNEAFDKNAAVKKNFFRKFGRRMGNVFTRKRASRGDLDELPPQTHPGLESSGVVINPLMAADIPSASVYQSSRAHPISVTSEVKGKGSGGGLVTGSRLSGDFPTVSSAMSEESVTGSGPPPERCLSEGNLVESSSPRQDQLGGFGGRIWRAVPTSMESLPKSLQMELQNKMNSRAHSVSEDEGLPHSPSDTLIHDEKLPKTVRASRDEGTAKDRLSAQTAQLSHSTRSLMSCDESSDGESYSANPLDLDFNALRRAESLDNTAAKHKIQVSRPRKSRSSSHMAGGLRKHKSMSTVQLSGISEEVSCPTTSESGRPRPAAKPEKLSSAASELAQELERLQKKSEKSEPPKAKIVSKPIPSQPPALSVSVSRSSRPTAVSTPSPDSKVTRLRSMFGSEAAPAPSADKPAFPRSYGVSGPPSAAPARPIEAAKPGRTVEVAETKQSDAGKKFQFGATSSQFKVPVTKAPTKNTTDKEVVSKKKNIQLREKKPVLDAKRPVAKSADDAGSRPASKVMDLVRNFQRMQETTSG